MCKACHTVLKAGGCAIEAGTRNEIVPGGTDRDTGPGTNGIAAAKLTEDQIHQILAVKMIKYQQLSDNRLFDYSHPVDDYAPQGNGGAALTFQSISVQCDYDMPVRYENVTVIVPVGATGATLQLGQRTLVLYSGAALTIPQVITLPYTGIILNSDDSRVLTFTGSVTTQGYVGLSGFAITRGQFS